MPNINQNLVGKHFGHLTVLSKAEKRGKHGQFYWVCQCDCGKKTLVDTASLNSGKTSSCGHVHLKNLKFSQSRHLKQLNKRPPSNNTSGYKNITTTIRHGALRYRVSVVYDHKQHSKLCHSLKEALEAREELRKKWWPNYEG